MKILFFAPFSAIWEHAALEARLAQAMQVRGHEVVFVTCGGVLRRNCVVMTASGLPTDGITGEVQVVGASRVEFNDILFGIGIAARG